MSEEERKFAASDVSAGGGRGRNGIFSIPPQRESLTEKVSMSSPQVLHAFFVFVVSQLKLRRSVDLIYCRSLQLCWVHSRSCCGGMKESWEPTGGGQMNFLWRIVEWSQSSLAGKTLIFGGTHLPPTNKLSPASKIFRKWSIADSFPWNLRESSAPEKKAERCRLVNLYTQKLHKSWWLRVGNCMN